MPWWNLISEGLLYPLTVQEWSTLAESYPRGKIADFVIHEDISDDDETEEDDVKDEEVENINDSSVIDSQSGSASKSHSVSVHSPMYLHPDFSDKSDWQLFPRQFSQFCTECYGRILADRNSYQNARFRVRLIRNADEILLETVQTSLSESHTIGNGSSSTSTEPPISPDQANKVGGGGGDGGNWHPKVLRVDAKLVFGPHVRLSRIVLGCLLVDVIRETGPDGREVSQSAAEQPTIKSTTFTDSPSTPSSQFSTCSSISAPSDVMQGKKSRLKQQCLDQSSDQMGLVRRSTRQRVHPSDLIVQGSSDQPLQHLKVQLMQLTGVIPSDQHLMFKGVELADHTKTLHDLGLRADSLLHLWTDTPPVLSTGLLTDAPIPSGRGATANKESLSPKIPVCKTPSGTFSLIHFFVL
ncbi:Ubiquitin-specific peptidase 48 (C19 family) [Fasciolopsis buskii]|uniref:Ubiquitin-specific peptidase 48 (C19 family) n=1 Tax=Fasciolopsis buskii TaxID=27845 RepID=A0A8E0VI04_9TREM|nr:Ubiquitin-specific peptidase 48 (C19 family) [Fasciolopsis buski]